MARKPRIAIIADWMTNMGGAESVVLALAETFDNATIFTSTYNPDEMPKFRKYNIQTTYLQNLPKKIRVVHKYFPTLRVRAFRKLDLSDYDIIISSASAEAKQVQKTRPDQLHICYCHTPTRYYWSHYEEYKKYPGFGKLNWFVSLALPLMVRHQRKLDYQAAQKIDLFIANSNEVKKRIEEYYHKNSIVIHPPVNVNSFTPSRVRDNYYVAIGRQVHYKRIDLAVAAATKLNIPLKVFGLGSEHEKLEKIAGDNVEFYTDRFGNASDKEVIKALNHAKGYIFPAEEDFGIVQVEALAAGAPVISYGKGGALDIIEDEVSGVLFYKQTVDSVTKAIKRAEEINFMPSTLRRKAKRFDKDTFKRQIKRVVAQEYVKNKNKSK